MEHRIIFATGNEGKMREIREILKELGVPVLSMKEAGVSLDIDENGKTCYVKDYSELDGKTLADDGHFRVESEVFSDDNN